MQALRQLMREMVQSSQRAAFRNHFVFSLYLHGLVVSCFLLALSLMRIVGGVNIYLPPWHFVVLMYMSAAGLGIIVALLRTWIEGRDVFRVARWLDHRLHLKDRLLTACELASSESDHPLQSTVCEDAIAEVQFALNRDKESLFPKRSWNQPVLRWIVLSILIWAFPLQIMGLVRGLWDRTPPTIVNSAPPSGAKNIRADELLTLFVEFSEEMNPADIIGSTIFVRSGNSIEPMAAKVQLVGNNRIARIELQTPLQKDGLYGMYVSWRIRDLAGNVLHAFPGPEIGEYWIASFRTQETGRPQQPFVITGIYPRHGDTDVSVDVHPQIDFTRPVNIAHASATKLQLRKEGEQEPVDCLVTRSSSAYSLLLEPYEALDPDTVYQVEMQAGIESRHGANLILDPVAVPGGTILETGEYVYSFRTASAQGGGGAGTAVTPVGVGDDQTDSQQSTPDDDASSGDSSGQEAETPHDGQSPQANAEDDSDKSEFEQSQLPGTETDDNLFEDPTDLEFNPIDVEIDPLLNDDAEFNERLENFRYEERQSLPRDGSTQETNDDSPLTYEDLFKKYEQMQQDNLDNASIPPIYRELVKAYFKRLRPKQK